MTIRTGQDEAVWWMGEERAGKGGGVEETR